MTTSAETGPNGPLPKEITQMYPDAPLIKRNGEVNAWDNPEFRAAVEATGRKQIILGGIVTEVCTMFLALSLRQAGYSVWANTEASGTATPKLAEDANRRMEGAGVHLVSSVLLYERRYWFSLMDEDWTDFIASRLECSALRCS